MKILRLRLFLGENQEWVDKQVLTYLSKDFNNPTYSYFSYFYELSIEEMLDKNDITALFEDILVFMETDRRLEKKIIDLVTAFNQLRDNPTTKKLQDAVILKAKEFAPIFVKSFDGTSIGLPSSSQKGLTTRDLEKKTTGLCIRLLEDCMNRKAFKALNEYYLAQKQLSIAEQAQKDKDNVIPKTPYTKENEFSLQTTIWAMRFLFDELDLKHDENIEGKVKLIDFLLHQNLYKFENLNESKIFQFYFQDIVLSGEDGLTALEEIYQYYKKLGQQEIYLLVINKKNTLKKNISNNIINLVENPFKEQYSILPFREQEGNQKEKTIRKKILILKVILELIGLELNTGSVAKKEFINFLCQQVQKDKLKDNRHFKNEYKTPEYPEEDIDFVSKMLNDIGLKEHNRLLKKYVKIDSSKY